MKGRVAFIPSAHKIEFHEYDVPAPAAGGIVAAVTQTNVCGSEVHMWKGEFGKRGVMPGHEMSGRIEALGAGVRTDWAGVPVKEGDRIAPVYYTVCNRCINCVSGQSRRMHGQGDGRAPSRRAAAFHLDLRHALRRQARSAFLSRARQRARPGRLVGELRDVASLLESRSRAASVRRESRGTRRRRPGAACDGDCEGARRTRDRNRRRGHAPARGASIRRRRDYRHARPRRRRGSRQARARAMRRAAPTSCSRSPASPRRSAKQSGWCASAAA